MMTVTDSFLKMMNFSDTFFLFYSLGEFCTWLLKNILTLILLFVFRVDEYRFIPNSVFRNLVDLNEYLRFEGNFFLQIFRLLLLFLTIS